jgi:hypothetical protein
MRGEKGGERKRGKWGKTIFLTKIWADQQHIEIRFKEGVGALGPLPFVSSPGPSTFHLNRMFQTTNHITY